MEQVRSLFYLTHW